MLGITDVKPVTEQDTDLSDHALEIVPVTHSELDFKHIQVLVRDHRIAPRVRASASRARALHSARPPESNGFPKSVAPTGRTGLASSDLESGSASATA